MPQSLQKTFIKKILKDMLLGGSYKKITYLFLCLSSHALASFSQSRNLSLEVPEYLGPIHEGDLLEGENLFHSFRQELENVLCHLVRRTRHIAKLEQKAMIDAAKLQQTAELAAQRNNIQMQKLNATQRR